MHTTKEIFGDTLIAKLFIGKIELWLQKDLFKREGWQKPSKARFPEGGWCVWMRIKNYTFTIWKYEKKVPAPEGARTDLW